MCEFSFNVLELVCNLLFPPLLYSPLQGCPPVVVPTLGAVFVDENLPDGTHLQPMTNFIKHWRMRNTGNMEWSSDTKVLCFSGLLLVERNARNQT